MADWMRPFIKMFYAPARAMAEVRDRAPLLASALLAFVTYGAYLLYVFWPYLFDAEEVVHHGFAGFGSVAWKAASDLLFTAIVFVPVVVFVSNMLERRASFGLALQQEYAPVASVILCARAMASLMALPFAALVRVGGMEAMTYQQSLAMLDDMARRNGTNIAEVLAVKPFLFAESLALTLMLPFLTVWVWVAVREVFRLTWARALVVVLAGGLIMLPLYAVLGQLFERVFASPFLLIMLFLLMRGYFGEMMRNQRARSSFKQNLEASTLNPADASAHYNLGLIHVGRKELDEARARFERAVEIDADELDAHYQLGRIARAQNRLPDAIANFGEVVARDPAHSQHEVWREIGATYVAAGQFADAQDALERFLERRQSDPEGLYLMGRANAGLGRKREAAEWMQACIEAVKTSPAYKYRAEKRWLNEAQQFLRTQA
ncbi:MAG: tetratricopeptide repeat protein [Pyrinomonadaceae bacterium]